MAAARRTGAIVRIDVEQGTVFASEGTGAAQKRTP